ncbi:MAG TPA: methyltransferase domain-containing protein [Bryobacteraceae bacterium]|nr:methyltransferase domain-containing protein [Bryobacteraceae bacterium]
MQKRNNASRLGLLVLAALPVYSQGLLYGQQRAKHYANSLAPYVVSPQQIVDRMLELADLKSGETVYDLGSGDGRILITAVQRFHAKAVGIEISDDLVSSTNDRIQKLGLQNDARVIHGDFRQVDLSPADVVVMYLATDANEMLRPNLEKYLKPGARVVTHEYAIPGWKPKQVDKDLPEARNHVIYLYEVPRKKK